jgi:hypothetical protein
MSNLTALQSRFTDALFDHGAPVPHEVRGARRHRAARRFGIYRNNVMTSLVNALGLRFPVTRDLVGEDSFAAVAQAFVVQEPPRSPVLLAYGAPFPRFLRGLGSLASIDYVADVAELEWACGRAYHAPDLPGASAQAFAAIDPSELPDLRVTFHPAVTLLASRFPVVSAWQAHHAAEPASPTPWRPEAAMVSRPRFRVEVRRLSPGGYVFLRGLMNGISLGESAEAALAASLEFDLSENLGILIGSGAVVALQARHRLAA